MRLNTLYGLIFLILTLAARDANADWGARTPRTNQEIGEWSKFHAERFMNWYAYKHFTRVDDWMFSSGMVTQDQIRAFDRDDPIRMSMMLVDLRLPGKESPSQSAKAKPIITITSSKDGHSISFEPDNINMNWSGGPSGSPHYPPTPWEGISWINLTAACGPLPDGEYALDVTWPGESDRPTLKANTSRFILGAVTLEQAAEFVHEKGEDNEIVKLKLTGESNATLFNGTDRAIVFTAGTGDMGSDIEAGNKEWRPMFEVELFKPNGWRSAPLGWCGTGMGGVIVQPGQTVLLGGMRRGMGTYNSGKEIWRVTLRWRFADDELGQQYSTAHSDFILLDSQPLIPGH